jgi:hypothetical protein
MTQNPSQPFSSEYTQSAQTLGQNEMPQTDKVQGVYDEPSLSVGDNTEAKVIYIYGLSKPRRVRVRGKILP